MDLEREIDRLDRRVFQLEPIPLELATIKVELTAIKEDIAEMKRASEIRSRERREEQAVSAKERKATLRWATGVAFTAASFVVAAVAVLLQAFGGG